MIKGEIHNALVEHKADMEKRLAEFPDKMKTNTLGFTLPAIFSSIESWINFWSELAESVADKPDALRDLHIELKSITAEARELYAIQMSFDERLLNFSERLNKIQSKIQPMEQLLGDTDE